MSVYSSKPTEEEQKIAIGSIDEIFSLIKKLEGIKKQKVEITFEDSEQSTSIPNTLLVLLAQAIKEMAAGNEVTLVSSGSDEITTQQAADLLNVSRPYMVKLLEGGEIPFRKVGRHRRVRLQDLMKYKSALDAKREEQLQFLADEAQELQMGYD